MLDHGYYKEMDGYKTYAALKKACRHQGNVMPVGNYLIVTRWCWNFDREELGYQGHIYRYTSDDRSAQAPIQHVEYSAADFEDFPNQAEAGAWCFGMITEM